MPNNIPSNRFTQTYHDYADEPTRFEMNVVQAADYATYTTLLNALIVAYNNMTNGNRQNKISALAEVVGSGPASDPASHREKKILVKYQDDTTLKPYRLTIPCRDDTKVTYLTNSDFLDLSASPQDAFVTAFEAIAASPAGNTVTVISMRAVGRNL